MYCITLESELDVELALGLLSVTRNNNYNKLHKQ